MSAQVKKVKEDPEERVESAIGQFEQFLYKNGKSLLTILFVIVLVVGGYFAYKHLYQAGRADKASAAMFVAQQNLQQELFDAALNGDGNNPGFLDVIAQFGSTPQGNIARHYAGMCYMHLGDLDAALDYLGQYKQVDGVPAYVVNAQNYGLRGDIHIQKGDLANAVQMYAKAIEISDNSFTAPYYLKKMGLAYMADGKPGQATDAFQRIIDEFPSSMEARDIEKYMGAAGQM